MVEGLRWVAGLALCVATMVYFEDIRALTRQTLEAAAARAAAAGDERRRDEPRLMSPAGQPPGPSVELKAGAYGHFQAPADVNGRRVDVMVDIGASMVALTYDDASRIGIHVRPSDFTDSVSTANGIARVAPVLLDSVEIGAVRVRHVRAVVTEPGKMDKSLLGMTFLSRLQRVEMGADRLRLIE